MNNNWKVVTGDDGKQYYVNCQIMISRSDTASASHTIDQVFAMCDGIWDSRPVLQGYGRQPNRPPKPDSYSGESGPSPQGGRFQNLEWEEAS